MAGRSGTENRKRTYMLPVRLDETERQALDELVEETGYSRAGYIRHRLFSTPLPRPTPKPRIEHKLAARILGALGQAVSELKKLNGQLGKIGSNINQLAHYAHLDKYQQHSIQTALQDFQEMKQPCLRAIRRFQPIRAACLKALGMRG